MMVIKLISRAIVGSISTEQKKAPDGLLALIIKLIFRALVES